MLSSRWPVPPRRGDERRILELVRALRERCEVRLLVLADGPDLPFDGVGVRSIARTPLSIAAGNAAWPSPSLPGQVRLYVDGNMRKAVREEVASFRPDVVCAVLARMAPYLDLASGAHRHIELIDALSLNMARRAAGEPAPVRPAFAAEAALLKRYERRIVEAADSSTLVADADRRAAPWLRSCAIVPPGVDLEGLPFRSPAERPPVLVFFGNLGYFPNLESSRVVAEEILPRVRRQMPEVTLNIVGARPAPSVKRLDALEGVTVVGPVDRMSDALHDAAVAIVPEYVGTGVKTKLTEAMAAGTPIVANAMAIEGILGMRPGVDHLSGESYDELAAACVRLLRDPALREQLAAEGRRLVEERFAWKARVDTLMELWGDRG